MRTTTVLEARTLGDLDNAIRDLQAPARVITPAVVARPSRLIRPILAVIVAAVGAGFVLPRLFASDNVLPVDSQLPTPVDLHTADGFRALIDAVEEKTGDSIVFRVDVSDHYGSVVVPADATSDRYVSYTWRDTGFEEGERPGTEADGVRFDLRRIDPEAIPAVLEIAEGLVEEPDGANLTVEVDPDMPKRCFQIFASNRFSEAGFVEATCSGKVLETSVN